MDIVIITLGIILMFTAIFLINKVKGKFSDEELIEYERSIRPSFIKYYYIGLLPLIVLSYLLITDIREALEYFGYIILILVVWDVFSILILNHNINVTKFRNKFKSIKVFIGLLIASKILLLFGCKIYLEKVLCL